VKPKPKAKKKPALQARPRCVDRTGPRADDTCSMTRVVEKAGVRLEVWTCTDPRPSVRCQWEAYRFPRKDARRWWPGCESAWYDAHFTGGAENRGDCTPGRTQYVVYAGGRSG
jgi:hypothetical protein